MDSQTLHSQQSLSLPTENQQTSNSFKSYDSIVKSLLYSLDVSENELVVLHYTETTDSKTKHKYWQHIFWLNKGKGQKNTEKCLNIDSLFNICCNDDMNCYDNTVLCRGLHTDTRHEW